MNRYEMEPILNPSGRFVIYGDHLNAIEKLECRIAELERDRKELLRVLWTLVPRLIETECDCGDEGLCDKHLVEVTLANHPKR